MAAVVGVAGIISYQHAPQVKVDASNKVSFSPKCSEQAPVASPHKEDFQAVDIPSISWPVSKWSVTVFYLMREGPPRARAYRPAARRDRLRHRHLAGKTVLIPA